MNFIQEVLFSGDIGSKKLNTFVALSIIPLINSELYTILQKEGFVSESASFQELESILEKDGIYYKLPKRARDYFILQISDQNLTFDISKIVVAYYNNELENEAEANTILYLDVYRFALEITYNYFPVEFSKWLIKNTPAIINTENSKSLQRTFVELSNSVNRNRYFENFDGFLTKAYIHYIICKLAYKDNDNAYAYRAIKMAVSIFEDIKNKAESSEQQNTYDEFYSLALFEQGNLNFELNKFNSAYIDFYEAFKLGNDLSISRALFRLDQYLGIYYKAEANLLEYKKGSETIDSTELKQSWLNAALLDFGTYYNSLNLHSEAIITNKIVLDIESQKSIPDSWQVIAMRNLGISHVLKLLAVNEKSDLGFIEGKRLLEESIRIGEKKNVLKLNSLSFIWLAKLNLFLEDAEKAERYLNHALKLLLTYQAVNGKEYFEYYIAYSDLLEKKGLYDDRKKWLINAYEKAQKYLGNYNPIIIQVIDRLLKIQAEISFSDILKKHRQSIVNFMSLRIRTNDFTPFTVDNKNALLDIIRDKEISLIPYSNEGIFIDGYHLPFFKEFKLICVYWIINNLKIVRYFLYKREEELKLLNSKNTAMLEVAKKDLKVNDPENSLKLYIRFYFDAVEGVHGKFYVVENLNSDIPWKFNITNEEAESQVSAMKKLGVKKIDFLYTDNKHSDLTNVQSWHFSVHTFFKDAVFSAKMEISEDGAIRLYDEVLLKEGFSVLADMRPSTTFI